MVIVSLEYLWQEGVIFFAKDYLMNNMMLGELKRDVVGEGCELGV